MSSNLSDRKSRKVLLLITRLDRGGSAEVTEQLAAGLVEKGYEVEIISGKTVEPSFDPAEYAEKHGYVLSFIPSLVRSLNPFLDILAFFQIYRAIRRFRPKILHTNTSKAGFLGRFAGRLAHVPVIVHSTHGHIFYGYYSGRISRVFVNLEILAAHCCDKILNLTERGMNDHLRERIARREKFIVSSCGIEIDRFYQTPHKKRSSDEIVVCWAGRAVAIKNLPMFIKAAGILQKKHVPVRCVVVGDGDTLKDCQKLAGDLYLGNIQFLGFRQDLPEIFAASDLFVLTSLNEGFGRVIIEAMASGLPVIATDVGGIPDIIFEGINGFLIPSDDEKGLADAIEKLVSDEPMRRSIGSNNKKVAEYYSLTNYINRVCGIYQEIIRQKEQKNENMY
ncbi:MAG: glycosyltransferase family 4 protein [Candidatus Marinimicrobia bacterium]|nr:glycosyltransferase family 4 protein [Candidatus Neomarinimicrobiota bacterium]